jgi:hypothetical protein
MTVRDIYQQRQIGKIAQAGRRARHRRRRTGLDAAIDAETLDLRRGASGSHAAAGHAAHGAVAGAVLHLPLLHRRSGRLGGARSPPRSACSCWRPSANSPSPSLGKWLIAGRLKAGVYPLWGLTYYRWWLADRLVEAAPAYLLSGSSLNAWWLRALGAKVGKDVTIGSMTLRAGPAAHRRPRQHRQCRQL